MTSTEANERDKRKRGETLLSGERRLLEMIVRGSGAAPETMAADPDIVVRGFLQRLQKLEAQKFISDAPSAAAASR